MKFSIWLALAAVPGWAHMKSMSSGDHGGGRLQRGPSL
jgi:hypothetical protein